MLALCNLASGGTLVVGVTGDYDQVGLGPSEQIDTSIIRKAVEKYVDGDFAVLAAEHELVLNGETQPRRFGIVYFRRRSAQPVLAAIDGNVPNKNAPVFRQGDILIRRGAQSIRANSGDVRRLLTSSVVNQERVKAVNELWTCLVEQRRLVGGLEYLYEILVDSEYPEVIARADLRASLGVLTEHQHAMKTDELQTRVNLVRPYLTDHLYQRYRLCAAFAGRIQMKAIAQRDKGIFRAWTQLDDGRRDSPLVQIASQILTESEIQQLWAGQQTDIGTWRPLRPAIDASERSVLEAIRRVLAGLA